VLTRATEERLADDVQLWVADGLISTDTAFVLRQRYGAPGFGLATLVKYLGISGGLFAFLGIVGFVTALSGSKGFGAFVLTVVGGAGLVWGLRLARDAQDRYALSSKVVTALGATALGLGAGVTGSTLELSDSAMLGFTGAIVVPLLTALAYQAKNPFLLIVAVLGFFHWVGTWDQMWGHSTYEIDVEDPKLISAAALVVFGIGYWHERAMQLQTLRFYRVYQALSLFYGNLSLLILSIDGSADKCLPWVLALTAVGIVQVALGARLHNSLVLGFGVTTLAIDLFTRYYEHFWDALDKGLFFLIGGLLLFGIGFGLERALPRKPASVAP
jgi:hypothetical protein